MQHGQNARLHLSGNAHPAAARKGGRRKNTAASGGPADGECRYRDAIFLAARTCPFPVADGNAAATKRPAPERVGLSGICKDTQITCPARWQPEQRLTRADYQHVTANLGNIWETL